MVRWFAFATARRSWMLWNNRTRLNVMPRGQRDLRSPWFMETTLTGQVYPPDRMISSWEKSK